MTEDNSTLTAFTAEYLARLLTRDYAGDDQGVVAREIERPEAERKIEKDNQTYLPAGAQGPKDTMGGAERVTVVPKRDPEPAKAPKVEPEAEEEQLLQDEGEVPIDAAPPAPAQPTETGDDTQEVADGPSEETEGWGIPDWYDEEDERFDSLEIDVMLRLAERRLAIDPNDSYSLSVLSYYQYLAMDYAAAEGTYDKYIALNPTEAAGYNNKGLIFKRRGEYIMEEAHYRVALDLDENDVTALNNLAVCLAHQGRFDEALGVMARLELLDPGDAYADLHRSKIYAQMGDDAKALEYLDAALNGMQQLDTLHHIEFRQDIRIDPSFASLRGTKAFRELLWTYYGEDAPVVE
jgi:tetratricopeptide (TPR) repeat protein